jgi:hypothetical protein
MFFTALVALSVGALLIAAIGAAAVGLLWTTAALERWLDTAPAAGDSSHQADEPSSDPAPAGRAVRLR